IPGALTKSAIVVHAGPMLPRIIRSVEATVLGLDDCINPVRISSGNGDADFPEDPTRKAVALKTLPSDAIVFGAIKSAARATAGEKPWLSSRLPKRCEHDVRIMRIENDVDAAGVFIFRQNFRPRLAAIGRAKDSTLLIWTEGMA